MRIKRISLKIRKKAFAGEICFALAILSKGLIDALFSESAEQGILNLLKYFFLIAACFCFYQKKQKRIFRKEFRTLMLCYFVIAIISVFCILYAEQYTFRTIKEFAFALVPIIFVYMAINAMSRKDIENMAKFACIVYLFSYFLEIKDTFSFSVALDNIRHFSLAGGQASNLYSSYESNHFPDPMVALLCYFSYHKAGNRKWLWLSFISVILMNKRLLVVFAILVMLITYIPVIYDWLQKKSSRYIYLIPAVVFTFSPILILYLTSVSGENRIMADFGINMGDFWMGRDSMVRFFSRNNYRTYGLGSTYDFMGSLFEIESVKFYFETTIIGSAVLSFSYWRIVRKSWYLLLVMLYIFLNMNTSTSIMTGAFAWIYYLFLIGEINHEKEGNRP